MKVGTKQQIVDHWRTRQNEDELSVEWEDALEHCWRCGHESNLEKCHIVPKSLGGSDDVSNLVLLCNRCHKEAPNVQDHRFMWIWLKAHAVELYNSYWYVLGIKEYRKMFNREPMMSMTYISSKETYDAFAKSFSKAVKHYGEGRLNASTIACIMFLAEEGLNKQKKGQLV